MSNESKKDIEQGFEIRSIPIEKIIPSENNHYSIERIEELAASIETQGLMHNLVVLEANERGEHELISGERRLHACRMLYEGGNQSFATIPCKVDPETDRDAAELKLIFGNSTARILSDAEKTRQVARSKELLKKMKDKGYPIKGRLRSALATLYGVSDAQIGRMESIDAHLTPEIKEEFQGGTLGVTAAYEISTLPEEEQPEALEAYKTGGVKAVQEIKKEQNKTIIPPPSRFPDMPEVKPVKTAAPQKVHADNARFVDKYELISKLEELEAMGEEDVKARQIEWEYIRSLIRDTLIMLKR